jgi:hypothetical protein
MSKFKFMVLAGSMLISSLMQGCDLLGPSTISAAKGEGVAMLKIAVIPNSPFQQLARSAVLTITAPDMIKMTTTLSLTETSVEGTVHSIPAGLNRLFEVSVFDSTNKVCYRGSATAEIITDSTVLVTLKVSRVSGGAIINGTISEGGEEPIPGLLAYYPFNGNAADESDHGFNGTVDGAVLSPDRFGNPDKAYWFGGDSRISAPVTNLLSLSKFTLCVWMKGSYPGSYLPRLVAVGTSGSAMNYYGLLYGNGVWNHAPEVTKRLIFMNGFTTDYYGYNLQYSTGSVDTLAWHHAAVSYDAGRLKFYFDGVLDKDTMIETEIRQFENSAVLDIGYSGGGDRYIGSLDDVRIYDRAVSDVEIEAIYAETN